MHYSQTLPSAEQYLQSVKPVHKVHEVEPDN